MASTHIARGYDEELRKLSDAIAEIQGTDGVVFVDINAFYSVNERDIGNLPAQLASRELRPRIHVRRAGLAQFGNCDRDVRL